MDRSDRGGFLSVLGDRAFWLGLGVIVAGLVVFALLFNSAVMPIWTRHDAAVQVPDVKELTPDEAQNVLLLAGLDWEEQEQPYNPNVPADVVVDQSPASGTTVKPGRRIYYYVNVSPKQLVVVPDVVSLSEGKAREDVGDRGLVVDRVEMDTVRTPYENTVTRQMPASDSRVPVGTRVTLWISPGVESGREVTVPNVVGMSTDEARAAISDAGLWVDSPRAAEGAVTRQDPAKGERLNPGEEVRIYTDDDA
ncbi:PASTA domain-containing protein [Rubrivirga sp.]|uniref:PASTA domain-containing protein n=1 Tax=Rubrivirga sp. TaxID=1885344 RepID=UPI003B52262C